MTLTSTPTLTTRMICPCTQYREHLADGMWSLCGQCEHSLSFHEAARGYMCQACFTIMCRNCRRIVHDKPDGDPCDDPRHMHMHLRLPPPSPSGASPPQEGMSSSGDGSAGSGKGGAGTAGTPKLPPLGGGLRIGSAGTLSTTTTTEALTPGGRGLATETGRRATAPAPLERLYVSGFVVVWKGLSVACCAVGGMLVGVRSRSSGSACCVVITGAEGDIVIMVVQVVVVATVELTSIAFYMSGRPGPDRAPTTSLCRAMACRWRPCLSRHRRWRHRPRHLAPCESM